MTSPHLTLITGGSRSGKSSYAMTLAQRRLEGDGRAIFLATAQAMDEEMRTRIARHQSLRPSVFETIEEPLELGAAVAQLDRTGVLVIDCLTIWISNLLAANHGDDAIITRAERLADQLGAAPFPVFVVSGEVGSGIVPMAPLSRRFRDLLGWTNQVIGRAADQILLMVAGYPMRVK
jgi:adenosylcobinamide kinase / adenosylcobinamide-phosphate guanylyltransferase